MTSLWAIQAGDCLEGLAQQEPGIARMVFTDPPYNCAKNYGQGKKADRLPAAEYLGWCREWMAACARLLTPDGSMWVMINDRWAGHFQCLLEEIGLHWRETTYWRESFPQHQTRKFTPCIRPIFHFTRHRKNFVFNRKAVLVPSKRITVYGDSRGDPNGKTPDNLFAVSTVCGTFGERRKGHGHPAQLPLVLLRPIIACSTDAGDLIVDPFSGTGTTGHVAIESGRRYFGIELNPSYAARSRERLRNVQRLLPFGTEPFGNGRCCGAAPISNAAAATVNTATHYETTQRV
jgi:site-specific DNA-methyltransferase (adenine-specific)